MQRLTGELADVLLFEGRQLGILIVQVPLGVCELLLQKLGRAFGRLLARAQILAHEERCDLSANLLGCACVLRRESNIKARHSAAGRWDWLDSDRLLRHRYAVVHGRLVAGV